MYVKSHLSILSTFEQACSALSPANSPHIPPFGCIDYEKTGRSNSVVFHLMGSTDFFYSQSAIFVHW
jgi:hypothetical protein